MTEVKIFRNGNQIEVSDMTVQEIEVVNNVMGEMFFELLKKGSTQRTRPEVTVEQPKLVLDTKEEAPTEDLFKESESALKEEVAACTGNSSNCPICGNGDLPEEFLSDFSDALEELKEGSSVTRKAWLNQGANGYLELIEGNESFDSFISYFDNDENKSSPYTLTNDDLLAEDWLLIGKTK